MTRLLRALDKNYKGEIPFWFMRQAGRYLPEYRELRAKAGGFLELVYNPEWASEITIQPIRRFGMDAAILFSDILVVPQALGQNLSFETGEGPVLEAIQNKQDIFKLHGENSDMVLAPIYQTLKETRHKLDNEGFADTTLIGFAGAPWTVACYMVEGRGREGYPTARRWIQEQPELFQNLIDKIITVTADYLIEQIRHGAQIIQIFDSWSGLLKQEKDFRRWSIEPTKEIIALVRAQFPFIPCIGFPRGCGTFAEIYATETDITVLGLDEDADPRWIKNKVNENIGLQGNLSNQTLLAGGRALEKETLDILHDFSDRPFIFNLGHGIIKETPIENVEKLCRIIREFKR